MLVFRKCFCCSFHILSRLLQGKLETVTSYSLFFCCACYIKSFVPNFKRSKDLQIYKFPHQKGDVENQEKVNKNKRLIFLSIASASLFVASFSFVCACYFLVLVAACSQFSNFFTFDNNQYYLLILLLVLLFF